MSNLLEVSYVNLVKTGIPVDQILLNINKIKPVGNIDRNEIIGILFASGLGVIIGGFSGIFSEIVDRKTGAGFGGMIFGSVAIMQALKD